MNILCIGSHPDDLELNAGAWIMHHTRHHRVRVVYFWNLRDKVYEEAAKAALFMNIEITQFFPEIGFKVREYHKDRQKILNRIIKHKQEFSPDLVLAPSPDDAHQDHATVGAECLRAFKNDTNLITYQHPYNGTFAANYYFTVDAGMQYAKNQLLEIYKSQKNRSYMDVSVDGIAMYYGSQVKALFAEAFHIYRYIGGINEKVNPIVNP